MDSYGELPFPRTELAEAATRFAQRIEEPAVFNHSMRTYLYGRIVGEQRGLRPGHDYDDELLFLGCVLHDAGLSEEGNGDQRFDIDGADLGPNPEHPLPDGFADRVHTVLPRLHGAAALGEAIVGQALDKPHKAAPYTLPGELLRQRTGQTWPTWRELMTTPPSWNDYDGWDERP